MDEWLCRMEGSRFSASPQEYAMHANVCLAAIALYRCDSAVAADVHVHRQHNNAVA